MENPEEISPPQTEPASKGERTRAAIIEAAYNLFIQQGYHGASMRQIARQAGIALAGIYNHFESKEAIFVAVLEAYHPYHRIRPALDAASGDTLDEFVRDAAERVRNAMAGAEANMLPLALVELVEFQGRHLAAMAEKSAPAFLAFAERFATKRGQLRPVPLPVVLRAFIGLEIGFKMTDLVLKDSPLTSDSNFDWFGGMVDIYLHGILEPERDPSAPKED